MTVQSGSARLNVALGLWTNVAAAEGWTTPGLPCVSLRIASVRGECMLITWKAFFPEPGTGSAAGKP